MSFYDGFTKEAGKTKAAKSVWDSASRFAGAARGFGGAAWKGLQSSGDQSLKSILKLEGTKHLSDAARRHGGYLKAMGSQKGRKAMGEALGKAAPSLAAGGAYLYGGKKLYDKTLGAPSESNQQSQYLTNYYTG